MQSLRKAARLVGRASLHRAASPKLAVRAEQATMTVCAPTTRALWHKSNLVMLPRDACGHPVRSLLLPSAAGQAMSAMSSREPGHTSTARASVRCPSSTVRASPTQLPSRAFSSKPAQNLAAATRTAIAAVAAVAFVGFFFTMGLLALGLLLAAGIVLALVRHFRGARSSPATARAARAVQNAAGLGGLGGARATTRHRGAVHVFDSMNSRHGAVSGASFLARLLAPILKTVAASAAHSAQDVQMIREDIDRLLRDSAAAHRVVGAGARTLAVRTVVDTQVDAARSLRITFVAQGVKAYADIEVTVMSSPGKGDGVDGLAVAHAVLVGPEGEKVVLAGGGNGLRGRRWTNTVDV